MMTLTTHLIWQLTKSTRVSVHANLYYMFMLMYSTTSIILTPQRLLYVKYVNVLLFYGD